jgi:hypothetical protein
LERISARVDSITSKTRQIFINAGWEKAQTIETWNEKYEHYVPLHRIEVSGNTMPLWQSFNAREGIQAGVRLEPGSHEHSDAFSGTARGDDHPGEKFRRTARKRKI